MVRLAAAAALLFILAAAPVFAADGEQVFNTNCKLCHSGPSTALAPSLQDVAGSKIASKEDFTYSDALKAKADTWTDANLDAFLKGPADFAPGTRMFIQPLSDEDRAAVIDYLKTLKTAPAN
jgi:cytochrome c